VVCKTQQKLEKLPPLRVPQRPFNRSTNPEIGQLLKESNDLLNVSVVLVYITASSRYWHACLHYECTGSQLSKSSYSWIWPDLPEMSGHWTSQSCCCQIHTSILGGPWTKYSGAPLFSFPYCSLPFALRGFCLKVSCWHTVYPLPQIFKCTMN